jgi:hypothetical protein
MFDLQTGKTQTGGRGIDSFETKVIDNQVYVKIIQQEMKW